MRHSISVLAALLLAWTSMSGTALGQDVSLMPEEVYADDIALSERLGRSLYDRDTAAYVAGGALSQVLDAETVSTVDGWITVKEGDQYKVLFIDADRPTPAAVFMAFILDGQLFDRFAPPGGLPLQGQELAMWRARQNALSRNFMGCASAYNPVIVPYRGAEAGQGGLFVYLMPATTSAETIKAGGFELYDFQADGETLKGEMGFSPNCFDIERGGSEQGSLVLTHSQTPYPQEHHVFLGLLHESEVYVSTDMNGFIWKIAEGDISLHRQTQ